MKVLIIHASAGAGHTRAAEALYNGFQNLARHDVTIVDALDYTSPFYKKTYQYSYTFLVKYTPWLWGILFTLTDAPALRSTVRVLRRILNSLNGRKLSRFLIQERFDYLFSTHFFPNESAAALKREGRIQSKIVSVITDFDVHHIWVAKGIDHYAVACNYTKKKLNSIGIALEHITVTGIPIHAKFTEPHNKIDLQEKLGLKEIIFTVLIATGSFGMGPIEEVIQALKDYQVLVVCGHNKKLCQRLMLRPSPTLKVYGLVDNMQELMAVSDVMITKPGGLSIAEALASHLPMIFFSAIPGQETNNIKVLQKYGIASAPGNSEEIVSQLRNLSSSPSNLIEAQRRTEVLAKPLAVSNIIQILHE